MVNDRLAATAAAKTVVRNARRVAWPETHVTNDDVVCIEIHLMVANTYAITGRRLSRDRDKWVRYFYLRLQRNRPGHAKHYDPRSFGRTCRAKAAGPAIIKIRDRDHSPAAPSDRIFPKAFSPLKSRRVIGPEVLHCNFRFFEIVCKVVQPSFRNVDSIKLAANRTYTFAVEYDFRVFVRQDATGKIYF